MNNDKITLLFYKYFHDLSTEEENRELARLLNQHHAGEDIDRIIEEAWKNFKTEGKVFDEGTSQGMLDSVFRTGDSLIFSRRRKIFWVAAASIALLLSALGVTYFLRVSPEFPIQTVVAQVENDIQPGSNKALLTLSDGTHINLDDTNPGVITVEGNTRIIKARGDHLTYETSSVPSGSFTQNFHKLRTPRGGQYHLVLPDGTKVWLNADSSIEYPVEFSEDTRRVNIDGEVFFDIAKLSRNNRSIPFMVVANDVSIEVMGTQFNVNTYKDEAKTLTTLIEGSIKIKTTQASSTLVPGEGAEVTSQSQQIRVHKANIDQAVAWKNGYFHFQEASIQEIMRQLSKWYDVDVRFDGMISERKFSGEIPRSATLLQVLEILEISMLRPKIINNEIIIGA